MTLINPNVIIFMMPPALISKYSFDADASSPRIKTVRSRKVFASCTCGIFAEIFAEDEDDYLIMLK